MLFVAETGVLDFTSKEKHLEDTKEVLTYYAAKCKEANFTVKLIGSTAKDVGKRVCEAIEHFQIDFVVLGKRQEGGTLLRSFAGTNSSYITEHAECTVIVAKPLRGSTMEEERPFRTGIHSINTSHITKIEEVLDAKKKHPHFTLYSYEGGGVSDVMIETEKKEELVETPRKEETTKPESPRKDSDTKPQRKESETKVHRRDSKKEKKESKAASKKESEAATKKESEPGLKKESDATTKKETEIKKETEVKTDTTKPVTAEPETKEPEVMVEELAGHNERPLTTETTPIEKKEPLQQVPPEPLANVPDQ